MAAPVEKPDPEALKAAELIAKVVDQELFGGAGDSVDIGKFARLIAGYDSVRYYLDHMDGARLFPAVKQLYEHALTLRAHEGLIMEFGVASGRTLTQIANGVGGAKVHGFDSFKGLPEDWKFGRGKGNFARPEPPPVPPNAELVIGYYSETVEGFAAAHQQPVSFMHIDCDLYSSTAEVLTAFTPHIAPGTVVVFNEYFNYPGWQRHEFKAWQEFVARTGARYRYVACNRRHQQVVVVVDEAPAFRFADRLRKLPAA